jgi:hypothetical protein
LNSVAGYSDDRASDDEDKPWDGLDPMTGLDGPEVTGRIRKRTRRTSTWDPRMPADSLYDSWGEDAPSEWELEFPVESDSILPSSNHDVDDVASCKALAAAIFPDDDDMACVTCHAKPPASKKGGECDTCRKYRQRNGGKQRPVRLASRQPTLNLRRDLRPGEIGITRDEYEALLLIQRRRHLQNPLSGL